MGERLDRVLALLETLADGVRRGADALERLATQPSGTLPSPRRAQRRVARVQAPAEPVDELAAERASRALRRRGLR